MINKLLLIMLLVALSACEQTQAPTAGAEDRQTDKIAGLWRGVLTSPGGELPFGIDIMKGEGGYTAKILNGEERADTSSVDFNDNIISINFEWFDARITATLSEDGNSMSGQWSKTASGRDKTSMLDFSASKGFDYRFSQELDPAVITNSAGNWEVTFSDEDGDSIAVAELNQQGKIVTGTFLTPTGDYRFLAGSANNNKLYLSAFDGAHAFLFEADINNDKISNGH